MKYVRFAADGKEGWGLLDRSQVQELEGDVFGESQESGRAFRLAEVKLLPPATPTKIVCLG